MAVIPVKLDTTVTLNDSCNNWKCCFGCKTVTHESPRSKYVHEETVTKVTHVYEVHVHPPSPEPDKASK